MKIIGTGNYDNEGVDDILIAEALNGFDLKLTDHELILD